MIPLLEPEIPQKSKEYVMDCLDTGWLSYTGPYVQRFEDAVKCYINSNAAIAMSNGTGALWLALKALGVGPGDYVAVPTMTFIATVNAIIYAGAIPVFIDCNYNLQMDTYYLLSAKQRYNLKAVIPVHMLGNPCDIETIDEITDSNIFLIEDAAQALGSTYLNSESKIGTWSDAAMFSFSFNKTVAAGQGGMVTTNNKTLGDKLKYLSLQAKDDAEMYIHNEAGFNMGMSNINAALACGQIENIKAITTKKKYIKDTYLKLLGKDNLYYQKEGNGWLNAYRSKKTYKEMSYLLKQKEIQTRPLFYPNHLQKSFRKYPYFGKDTAIQKYEHTVCIPSSTSITDEQIEFVVKSIKECDN